MTSLRQKPKHSLETPVLFRLPDLRIHPAHSVSAWPTAVQPEPLAATAEAAAPSLRIDQAQSIAPAIGSNPAPQSAAIAPSQDATQAKQTRVAASESHVSGSNVSASHGLAQPARGWMERFGSRLILIVTLLVIMTAAWVTGQRVPASKSVGTDEIATTEDNSDLTNLLDANRLANSQSTHTHMAQAAPTEQPLPAELRSEQPSESSSAVSSPVQSNTTPSSLASSTNLVAKPAVEQPFTESSAIQPAPAQPAPVLATQEMSASLALEAPRSVHDDEIASLADAPAQSTSGPLLSAPAQSMNSGHAFTPVQSVAHDMSPKLPTTPAAPMSLAPAAGGGFYTGNESIEALPTTPAATPSQPTSSQPTSSQPTSTPTTPVASKGDAAPPSSSTPNQLKIDPNVLVPWANEQAMSQARQQSPTPKPILNWNDYLPAGSNSNVRAAAANIDPNAQPQVGMPAVSDQPAFSNSFYSN